MDELRINDCKVRCMKDKHPDIRIMDCKITVTTQERDVLHENNSMLRSREKKIKIACKGLLGK